jgi:hypothetical protein
VCSRTPDRSTTVGPNRNRTETGRDGRDRATARTARGERQIPRVARDTENEIVGVALQRELRAIGLAENDPAARAPAMSSVTTALICGLTASMRASTESSASSGVNVPSA